MKFKERYEVFIMFFFLKLFFLINVIRKKKIKLEMNKKSNNKKIYENYN